MTSKYLNFKVVSSVWYTSAYDETLRANSQHGLISKLRRGISSCYTGALNKIPFKRKQKDYVDFTDNSWKNNYLIGRKIITRPYKFYALVIAAVLMIVTTVIPGPNILGFWLIPKFLGRFG